MPIYPRPQYCYPVVVTKSSRFHPDPINEKNIIALRKTTHIEQVVFSRDLANIVARDYFARQHCESVYDAHENDFGIRSPGARKWGLWVPSNTTECTIFEREDLCRIEVVLDSGPQRTEFLVEVLREEVFDANGPMAKDDVELVV